MLTGGRQLIYVIWMYISSKKMLFRCMLFFDKKNSYHPYNYPKFK